MIASVELKETASLFKKEFTHWQKDGIHFFLNGESPSWFACEGRGKNILDWCNGQRNDEELGRLYSKKYNISNSKAWLHVHSFTEEALRKKILTAKEERPIPYLGRDQILKCERLKEFWIHLTQTCNLSCSHCLVSSSPNGEMGLETKFYLRAIEEACALGTERFYFTGGEPFVRQDIFDLIENITVKNDKELIILTNATLLDNKLEKLKKLNRDKIKFQISCDGTTQKTNDAIRGKGVFKKVREGLNLLDELGFECSLTAAVTRSNCSELKDLPLLAKRWGAKSVHLMWLHKRGRIMDGNETFPSNEELLKLARTVYKKSKELDISFDNMESLKVRINGQSEVKYDLSSICWESLCLYMDGQIYPSAAMAGHLNLSLGSLHEKRVSEIWKESPLAQKIRSLSLTQIPMVNQDPFRFLVGGGDIEHAYFFSSNGSESNWDGSDPYYDLYRELSKDIMFELAQEKKKTFNQKSGWDVPQLYHSMGDDSISCSEDAQNQLNTQENSVKLLHSNCVLSFDVEKPYKAIQKFYGAAAIEPKKELCCPVKYDESEVGHIPQEVLDRFYGCGSPISMAQIQSGETVLDLGSGAGIDCFIAAKKVGAKGHVIGVDMTDPMLSVANTSKKTVAANLGYDAVEFKKGFLEKIPQENQSVDLVTSNCVINLSPNKRKVFAEIWRILKDTGRFVVADIISDRTVPLNLQAHQDLWGECISGSLSQGEFLSELERAGFYGLSLIKKTFWKEVDGIRFYSITVRGFKFEKKAKCQFMGQKAIYMGPYKTISDEEGHLFPRGESIEVCTDTANKLKAPPYCEQFVVTETENRGFLGQVHETLETNVSCTCPKKPCGPSDCC